jgi:hypothetical protein
VFLTNAQKKIAIFMTCKKPISSAELKSSTLQNDRDPRRHPPPRGAPDCNYVVQGQIRAGENFGKLPFLVIFGKFSVFQKSRNLRQKKAKIEHSYRSSKEICVSKKRNKNIRKKKCPDVEESTFLRNPK